jgi:hypothetical protein
LLIVDLFKKKRPKSLASQRTNGTVPNLCLMQNSCVLRWHLQSTPDLVFC